MDVNYTNTNPLAGDETSAGRTLPTTDIDISLAHESLDYGKLDSVSHPLSCVTRIVAFIIDNINFNVLAILTCSQKIDRNERKLRSKFKTMSQADNKDLM